MTHTTKSKRFPRGYRYILRGFNTYQPTLNGPLGPRRFEPMFTMKHGCVGLTLRNFQYLVSHRPIVQSCASMQLALYRDYVYKASYIGQCQSETTVFEKSPTWPKYILSDRY